MNDKKNPFSSPVLKLMAIATFLCGVISLFLCHHMNSELPASANNLSPKAIENLLETLRQLVSANAWMSGFLILLSIVIWFCSQKPNNSK